MMTTKNIGELCAKMLSRAQKLPLPLAPAPEQFEATTDLADV